MTSVKKLLHIAVTCLIFFLPLQTRYIFSVGHLGKYASEYQTVSVYGTEILSWIVVVLGIVVHKTSLLAFLSSLTRKKKIVLASGLMLLGLSVLRSVDVLLSLFTVYHWLLLAAVGLVVYHVARDIGIRLLYAFCVQGSIQASLGLYQFFTQTLTGSKWFGMSTQLPQTLGVSVVENNFGRWLRAYGSFGWPTSLGIYLAVVIVTSVFLFVHTKNKLTRISLLIMSPVILSGLFITFARGAWIAAAAGLFVMFIMLVREYTDLPVPDSQKQGQDFVVLCCLLGMLVVSYAGIFEPLISTRLTTTGRLEQQSVTERVTQYYDAWSVFVQHPFTGVGPGTYTTYLFKTYPERDQSGLQPIHNVFVLILVEYGLLFVVYILYVTQQCLKYRTLTVLGGAILSCMFVAGLFDHWLVSMWGGRLLVAVIICFSTVELKKPQTHKIHGE